MVRAGKAAKFNDSKRRNSIELVTQTVTEKKKVKLIKHALESCGLDCQNRFMMIGCNDNGKVCMHGSDKFDDLAEHLAEIVRSRLSRRHSNDYNRRTLTLSTKPTRVRIEESQDEVDGDGTDVSSIVTTTRPALRSGDTRRRELFVPFYDVPGRTPRQDLRTTLPREAVRYGTTTSEDMTIVLQPRRQMLSFRIGDTLAVIDFLIDRLNKIQQLADKKIAKAWIKGICPKKQAIFPYQNNREQNDDGERRRQRVPGWWPDPDRVCPFLEPDHIKKHERIGLCIHLLRLRPAPEQLREWNQNKSEAHPTHVQQGWTAFLKELAGFEVFDELPKVNPELAKYRQNLMTQMYEVAAMEEAFENGERDGDDRYYYEEDDDTSKVLPTRRSRRPSNTSTTIPEESTSPLMSMDHGRRKRARRGSRPDMSAGAPEVCEFETGQPIGRESAPSPPEATVDETMTCPGAADVDFEIAPMEPLHQEDLQASPTWDSHPFIHLYHPSPVAMKQEPTRPILREAPHPEEQWVPAPGIMLAHSLPLASPAANFAESPTYPAPAMVPTGLPWLPDYPMSPFAHHDMLQVQQVSEVPEPQFHAIPGAHLFPMASSGPALLPLSHFMPENGGGLPPSPGIYSNSPMLENGGGLPPSPGIYSNPPMPFGQQYLLPGSSRRAPDEYRPMGPFQQLPLAPPPLPLPLAPPPLPLPLPLPSRRGLPQGRVTPAKYDNLSFPEQK